METTGEGHPRWHPPRKGAIDNYPHADLTEEIIGAMYTVHRKLGAGFLESVYKNALAIELRKRGLRVERNVPYEIFYDEESIGLYVADFIVESKVIVEAKVARSIHTSHRDQTLNYLQASKLEVGLVLKFGTTPQSKRVIRSRDRY